jgi:hypothetical protein
LYSVDIALADTASPINAVELFLTNGVGHTAVFAVSGASLTGSAFAPIEIGCYNEDVVVEASALKPGFLETNTTATMDSGTANLRFTWYERGYCSLAPGSGLPPAGSLLTNQDDASHRFILPSSYTDANAILLDSVCTNAVVKLVAPAPYSALSFLTASAHGPVTNRCVISHADGRSETNEFVSPDWLGNSPAAFATQGRVSVSTRLIDNLGSGSPRLYAVDVPLTNTASPVTRIRLALGSADADGHAVVLAVSGSSAGVVPRVRPALTIVQSADGNLIVHSSQPGTLESCSSLSGTQGNWKPEGPISSNLTVTRSAGQARFYRVVSQ